MKKGKSSRPIALYPIYHMLLFVLCMNFELLLFMLCMNFELCLCKTNFEFFIYVMYEL
jgi:hypothetical protein